MYHHPSSAAASTTPYEIEGRAFLPGETIGVTILLRDTEANRYGEAQALINAAELPSGCEGVLLFGYDSGMLYYEDPR